MITETQNGFNIEGNELNINCITSKENKFHLDSEGNLIVNSITTTNNESSSINYQEIFNSIYPVGAIYLSIDSKDPSTLFGGVWERISKGRTLVGVDENDTDFNMSKKIGGSKYLQRHQHDLYTTPRDGAVTWINGVQRFAYDFNAIGSVNTYQASVTTTGAGDSGNLQPYITCYIWNRIA